MRGSVGGGLNVKSAFLHMLADAASSVVVIIGAVIVSITGWYIVDPLLGIGISVLIFVWAWGLLKDSVNVLLETAPKGMDMDTVSSELITNVPEIVEITDLHVWEITSGMYSLTAHIKVDKIGFENSKKVLHRINKVLDKEFGIGHTTIQLESEE
ncbi:TPA: cation transporter [Candidatus Bathyarchaeota archaeon]|nr:cation transporter [Candidatus Bathyarchaeota archaeon]